VIGRLQLRSTNKGRDPGAAFPLHHRASKRKLLPFTVSVKLGPPAVALDGDKRLIEGASAV